MKTEDYQNKFINAGLEKYKEHDLNSSQQLSSLFYLVSASSNQFFEDQGIFVSGLLSEIFSKNG